eukprot:4868155-Amphidinium_carterae.1
MCKSRPQMQPYFRARGSRGKRLGGRHSTPPPKGSHDMPPASLIPEKQPQTTENFEIIDLLSVL